MARSKPHRLDLYRLAVQHPEAEVGLLLRAYTHYNDDRMPSRLKEDFAGSSVIASTFVSLDENHRALAVEAHGPTAQWAAKRADRELGERAEDCYIIQADVLEIDSPKVDVIAAMNFSTFIYHDRAALVRYFRAARKSLRPGGILAMDCFGGPGAMRLGVQTRQIQPAAEDGVEQFTYEWEQRSYDAVTGKIDCRIHFALADGSRIDNAFRYDWRLWTLPELQECLLEAKFTCVEVWCDQYDPETGQSDGHYRPISTLPAREDWVAYVIAQR